MEVEQFFCRYEKWECFLNGMYDSCLSNEKDLMQKAINILIDEDRFYSLCELVLKNWKISSRVHLTNPNCNKKAWLGQASCCYSDHVPEYLTKKAWSILSEKQRAVANKVAEDCINKYLSNLKTEGLNQIFD